MSDFIGSAELKTPGSRRSKMDRIVAQLRHDAAVKKNQWKPLSFDQLRAIGITPKGTRSSTGRKAWTLARSA